MGNMITVGDVEFQELVWRAYEAGVPLRICMAPEHAIARLQYLHKKAREPMYEVCMKFIMYQAAK